jgi:hypothetical protein
MSWLWRFRTFSVRLARQNVFAADSAHARLLTAADLVLRPLVLTRSIFKTPLSSTEYAHIGKARQTQSPRLFAIMAVLVIR